MAQKNDLEWLVTIPDNTNFTSALTAACKGNEKLANTLNYFLFEAAREAKKQGASKSDVEYIEIERTLDDILRSLSKHNKSVSKKTLHSRIVNLTSMSYLQSDGYRYTYKVFVKNIQEAINTPPEAEKPKPRGRHAHKGTSEDNLDQNEDGSFDSKVKSTILPSEMEDLRGRMVNLQSEMVELQSRMVNLQSQLSHERACREALEAKIAPLYSIDTVIDISKLNGQTKQVTKPRQPKETKPTTPEKPTPPAITLSETEQTVFDTWAKMPWFKGVIPKLEKNDPEHLQTLASYEPTFETMLKVRNWATSKEVDTNGWYKRRGWSLYGLAKEYPKWLSIQQPTPLFPDEKTEKLPPKMPTREELRKMVY